MRLRYFFKSITLLILYGNFFYRIFDKIIWKSLLCLALLCYQVTELEIRRLKVLRRMKRNIENCTPVVKIVSIT